MRLAGSGLSRSERRKADPGAPRVRLHHGTGGVSQRLLALNATVPVEQITHRTVAQSDTPTLWRAVGGQWQAVPSIRRKS